MADYKMYKIGITPKGAYGSAENYEFLDLVLYDTAVGGDGCAYIALADNVNVAPGTNSDIWMKASQTGSSIYDLAVKYGHFSGTEEEFAQEYQDALAAATNAAASSTAAQARLENAETLRAQAEQARVAAEGVRAANEVARGTAESDRASAESTRASAETSRNTAESVRVSSEAARTTAENARASAESARVNAESARVSQASSDHSRAEIDHTTAVTDHQNIADKADADGWYSDMTVGYAENLVDTKSEGTEQQFTLRTSHGTESIADEGSAYIKEVRGSKSVVWNQLLDGLSVFTDYGVTATANSDGSYTLTGTATGSAEFYFANRKYPVDFAPSGHKILFLASGFTNSYVLTYSPNYGAWCDIATPHVKESCILYDEQKNLFRVQIRVDNGVTVNETVKVSVFDLTLMFGAGNEPATVAEFEEMFPKSYYPYNAGTVLNLTADKILTDGFNQWDEEWLNGYYEPDPSAMRAGQFIESSRHICSKNPIPVFPSTSYYTLQTGGYVVFYDSGMNIISNFNHINNNLFTTPSNCRYIHFNCSSSYGATYKHDICINLVWSGYRNGEYEPYKKNERELNLTTLTGKLNGTGNSTVIFPNGLVGIGDVYDSVDETRAVKRFGVVDLGTLNWSYNTSSLVAPYFVTALPISSIFNSRQTFICPKYIKIPRTSGVGTDKVCFSDSDNTFEIKDSAYTDVATFKAAMSGVLLYFERDQYETYILDEPMKLVYPVEDFGKEWIEPVEDASGNPTTTPFRAVIKYNQDFTREIANLPTNYVRRDALKQSVGYDTTLPLSQKGTDDNYARKIGEAPRLIAGSAKNLEGNTAVNEEFVFKAIPSGIGEGAAKVNSVKGKSLVWNQLVQNGNFANTNYWVTSNATKTISNNVASFTAVARWGHIRSAVSAISGHKYYISAEVKPTTANINASIGLGSDGYFGGEGVVLSLFGITSISTFTRVSKIGTYNRDAKSPNCCVILMDYRESGWDTIQIKNFILIDLTLMFGSGNEPTTVAEFEKMFPLPYYDYNPGEIINNQTEEVEVVGFNQWDEEWENGYFYESDGNINYNYDHSATCIRSKNYIPVLPNTSYSGFVGKSGGASVYRIAFFDKNKVFISMTISSGSNPREFTTPSNCCYIKFFMEYYSDSYLNDICINISDSSRNRTYEPHKSNNIELNISTLTGKLNGEGESVVVFPDGLKSAGSVYDEIVGNKAIKRIGSVDLGTLYWFHDENSTSMFSARVTYAKTAVYNESMVLCPKYASKKSGWSDSVRNSDIPILQIRSSSNVIDIKDVAYDNYSDANFKAAMSGVMLYYELDTPEEYILDEPIHDTFQAYSGGTMHQLPENTSTPASAPMVMNSTYAMDAVGLLNNLPPDYMSKESMQAFLSALQLSGILSSYSMTWNSELGRYVFLLAKQS